MTIVLASASPRRQMLLAQIGITPIVHAVSIDEAPRPGEAPVAYVRRLAAAKSARCAERLGTGLPILAADTAVAVDGQILGKPASADEAAAMLGRLSGRAHQVHTAVSLRGKRHRQALSSTWVRFRALSAAEIWAYCQSGEPMDKAGAYAVQGRAALFVSAIHGSFSGVVGLPLFETGQLLSQEGVALLP